MVELSEFRMRGVLTALADAVFFESVGFVEFVYDVGRENEDRGDARKAVSGRFKPDYFLRTLSRAGRDKSLPQ